MHLAEHYGDVAKGDGREGALAQVRSGAEVVTDVAAVVHAPTIAGRAGITKFSGEETGSWGGRTRDVGNCGEFAARGAVQGACSGHIQAGS